MNKIVGICCLLALIASCKTGQKTVQQPPFNPANDTIAVRTDTLNQPILQLLRRTDAAMETLLKRYPNQFADILKNRDNWNVQFIYTQIDRNDDNTPVFTPFYFNVSDQAYFYPASTVKLPVALLALEKLNRLKIAGLTKYSPMLTEAAAPFQTPVFNDPTSQNGIPSIAQYIKKILLVSDNDAFNRLYEWVGQETINSSLRAKGYSGSSILHRLEQSLTVQQNRITNPIRFLDPGNLNLLYQQPQQTSKWSYPTQKKQMGKGYYSAGKLINQPMDFTTKNCLPLEDLNRILKATLFPEAIPASERFDLTADDYLFLKKYMSQLPGETVNPSYDRSEYWDSFVKFLYYGSEKEADLRKSPIRIFNKVGDAYGTLIDAAYIVDFESGIEFMLTATIYCNSDGILNDDRYDYETVGFPFLKHLGKAIYDLEKSRTRARLPDLSAFRMQYEK